VQLISLKGPGVSLLFPLRTASLRVPIRSLPGHLYRNVKRTCRKCRTQTTEACRLKTEHRVERTLPQKKSRYRNISLRTLLVICSRGLCLLVWAISATLCREAVSMDTRLTYTDKLYILGCQLCCSVVNCAVLCTVCVYMCTVLLPPGVKPFAIDKYISYHITSLV
jgi:hypothetical protein